MIVGQLKPISVGQYIKAPDEQYLILDLQVPKNSFAGKQMNAMAMPFTNVKTCIKLLSKDVDNNTIFELFNICFGVDKAEFDKAPIAEYFSAKNFIVETFTKLVENEAKIFGGQNEEDALWLSAGSEKLNKFSDILPLIGLGKAFGQYPFDIGMKPYSEVLTLMIATKAQNEVEVAYQKLKQK